MLLGKVRLSAKSDAERSLGKDISKEFEIDFCGVILAERI